MAANIPDNRKFGFIIFDNNCVLFGSLENNRRVVLDKISFNLPTELPERLWKQMEYAEDITNKADELFAINVDGIIVAISWDMDLDLLRFHLNDPVYHNIIKFVRISYGGECGFNEAIDLSVDKLGNLKYIQERNLIQRLFDEINQNTPRFCFGVDDTMRELEMGAVETLIVWENLAECRYTLMKNNTGETKEIILRPEEIGELCQSQGFEVLEEQLLLDFLTLKYKDYKAVLETVSDTSPEGSQFVKGLGGIGGILRCKVDFRDLGKDILDQKNDDSKREEFNFWEPE